MIFGFLVYIGLVGPETHVVPGSQMRSTHLAQIRDLGLLDEDEKIKFFYSDGFLNIEEGFYFFSSRKVVVYSETFEEPSIVIPYADIADLEFDDTGSFLEDSRITLILTDSTFVWFPVSNETDGDEKFFETLKAVWKRSLQSEN